MVDIADADDTPEQNQLLMSAWQALATYAASCDDEDKPGAMIALKVVSNLLAGGEADGPFPTGTFGVTSQIASSDSWTCPQCSRSFGSEQGLINHLAAIHKQRETTDASPKTEKD